MRRTDYTTVSRRYDENEDRFKIPTDDVIGDLAKSERAAPLAVLDLACGTGNYLAVQTGAFAAASVRWFGVDASEAMLAIAQRKVGDRVDLRLGRAESLPFDEGQFDYVITSFAFHHFEDKPKALDEMARVLKPGGTLRVQNIAPTNMPAWWVYRVFPQAVLEDEKRFWSPALLVHELEVRRFEPHLRVEYERSYARVTDVLTALERRELSQLAILDDDDIARGLARLRAIIERDPEARVPSEIALLRCTARRTGVPIRDGLA